jgi:hypothetical protein
MGRDRVIVTPRTWLVTQGTFNCAVVAITLTLSLAPTPVEAWINRNPHAVAPVVNVNPFSLGFVGGSGPG